MAQEHSMLFTSESVTEGHPDKIADQISDTVLDAVLAQDPLSRVACETLITTGVVIVAGEITTNARIDIPDLVRGTVRDIGYDDALKGFDCNTCSVMVTLDRQSPDIAQGVDGSNADEVGAGDQYHQSRMRTFLELAMDMMQVQQHESLDSSFLLTFL